MSSSSLASSASSHAHKPSVESKTTTIALSTGEKSETSKEKITRIGSLNAHSPRTPHSGHVTPISSRTPRTDRKLGRMLSNSSSLPALVAPDTETKSDKYAALGKELAHTKNKISVDGETAAARTISAANTKAAQMLGDEGEKLG